MTEKEKRGIAAVEIDALKRSCGISRRDRIQKEVIKRKMKIREIVEEEMQGRQLNGEWRRTTTKNSYAVQADL